MSLQVQAKAQAMATALQTIGKFVIKKRSGDKESIFGRYGRALVARSSPLMCGEQHLVALCPWCDLLAHRL